MRLEVRELIKSYPHVHTPILAVNRVSFDIAPGEMLGLIGHSGCGKSTLANLILCFISGDNGQIFIDGREITGLSQRRLRRIRPQFQMIFQDAKASLNPRMTIGQSIAQAAQCAHRVHRRAARGYALEIMRRCGLTAGFFDRYPHELSGGQCQRACIARAIAVRPKLLIADEPVCSLDITMQIQILELIATLCKDEQMGCLLIGHDLHAVRAVCNRVMVMREGRIIESGPVEAIFANGIYN